VAKDLKIKGSEGSQVRAEGFACVLLLDPHPCIFERISIWILANQIGSNMKTVGRNVCMDTVRPTAKCSADAKTVEQSF